MCYNVVYDSRVRVFVLLSFSIDAKIPNSHIFEYGKPLQCNGPGCARVSEVKRHIWIHIIWCDCILFRVHLLSRTCCFPLFSLTPLSQSLVPVSCLVISRELKSVWILCWFQSNGCSIVVDVTSCGHWTSL